MHRDQPLPRLRYTPDNKPHTAFLLSHKIFHGKGMQISCFCPSFLFFNLKRVFHGRLHNIGLSWQQPPSYEGRGLTGNHSYAGSGTSHQEQSGCLLTNFPDFIILNKMFNSIFSCLCFYLYLSLLCTCFQRWKVRNARLHSKSLTFCCLSAAYSLSG